MATRNFLRPAGPVRIGGTLNTRSGALLMSKEVLDSLFKPKESRNRASREKEERERWKKENEIWLKKRSRWRQLLKESGTA